MFKDNHIFDFGRGVIVNIKGQDIAGTTSIILKECINTMKEVAYIIELDINGSIEDKKTVLHEIIEEAKTISQKYGATLLESEIDKYIKKEALKKLN